MAHAEPEPTPSPPISPKFPSAPLIVMSVMSCFLVTAVFVSSLTQLDTRWPYFLVPSGIGCFITIPFHVHLYKMAQKHRLTNKGPQTNPIFITPKAIIFTFILVSLWAVIFFINILFCVGTDGEYFGIILATILAGFEWIALLFIGLKCIREIWRYERNTASDVEHQSSNIGRSSEAPQSSVMGPQPHPIYLVSFVLCTLALVFSIFPTKMCLVNVIAFSITAPHHIAIFVASLKPQSPAPPFAQPSSVALALFLAAVWCWVFVVDIIGQALLFQKILSGIFGGLECIVVICIAVRTVLDSFEEGQIRLE